MLAVTLDIDWSPDPIVDAVMALFDRAQVPVTLFCTDPDTDRSGNSSPLTGRYHRRNELGLHPNFAAFGDSAAVFSNLLAHYPEARGFRSHNGCTGWPITSAAAKLGLLYEVECLVFPVDVPPFTLNDPMNFCKFVNRFMDANQLHQERSDWSIEDLGLSRAATADDGLFVINFHPNIVYYDMMTVDDYLHHRPHYHEPREQDSFLHKPVRGPAKLVRELLASVERDRFTTVVDFGRSRGFWR